KAITGQGVEAVVDGKEIRVVSPGYLKMHNISVPENFSQEADETVVFVLMDNKLTGYIGLADAIRPESFGAIKTLRNNHIKPVLLAGDNKRVAESVSKKLGVDEFYSEVLPHQKLEKIKELQGKGEFVA